MTCVGTLHLKRRWWGNRCPCTLPGGYHVDDLLGLDGFLSRRLQKKVCRMTADRSFEKAREDLLDLLGVPVSAETLRTLSEAHGRKMAAWQPQDEQGPAAFRAAPGEVEFTVDAGKVNTREEGWKDLKIAVLQKRVAGEPTVLADWDKQRLPEASARFAWGQIASIGLFQKGWRAWMQRVGVEQMASLHVLGDGADWIWRAANHVLTGCMQTLDVYHALSRVAKAGKALYGEGTEAAKLFQSKGQVLLLAEGWPGLCRLVSEEYAQEDTPGRRTALEALVSYFVKHTSRLHYAEGLACGRAIGSGVVEGQAKTLGLRLKARGARWKKGNVLAMTALVCVRNSDHWETYWSMAA